jgi:hypothetical protein
MANDRFQLERLTAQNGPHVSEEQLESYVLCRLAEPALSSVEEHLLICKSCLERVEAEQLIADTVKTVGTRFL